MHNNSIKKAISVLLTITVILAGAYYLKLHKEDLGLVRDIGLTSIAAIISLNAISIYQNGLFLKIISRAFNINLKEHFQIAASTAFYNLILPLRGGAIIRAVYMKKIHGQQYSHFISSILGNYIIIFLIGSIFALASCIYLFISKDILSIPVTVAFSTIFLTTTYLAFNGKIPKFKINILNKINKVTDGWEQITRHPKNISKLIINTALGFLVESIKIKIILSALGIEIGIFESLYFATISLLATFINITPGSLGISEGLFMISSTILNIPPQIGLIAAIINRILNTVLILAIGPICNFLLYKNQRKNSSIESQT